MAETKFRLNLDTAEFIEAAKRASESLTQLGESGKNLNTFTSTLGDVAKMAGVVGSAFLILKTAMDAVFEAENIKAVNNQFELLTKNAGISTEALKEGLEKSANGLASETELLKAANNALVTMAGSASKLPELMELARKSTAVFGGDFIQNFEQMNMALATGNMRMLKHMGIILDETKALRDYAVSHGTVVSALSDEEKQQARVNAALEKGKTAFAGVNTEIKVNTTAWQQLKVILTEIMESISLLANTFLGKYLKTAIDLATGSAKEFHTFLSDKFGEGVEQASAHSRRLKSEYDDLDKKLKELNTTGQTFFNGALIQKGTAAGDAAIDAMKKKMAELKGQIDQSTKAIESFSQKSTGITGGGPAGPKQDDTKRLEAANKFEKELDGLRKQRLDAEIKEAHSLEEVDKLHEQKRIQIVKDFKRQEDQIRLQYQKGEIASVKQRDAMIDQIEKTKTAKIKSYERELESEHKRAMKNMTDDSENAAEGIANAFKESAEESRQALTDWGQQGRQTVDSFKTHSTEAFLAVGAGSKSMGEAMRGMFLNVIADKAQSMGSELLLEGLWPPNPLALGAGAALITLAGALRAKAGGGGGVSVPASGGGGMVPVTSNQNGQGNQMQAQQPGQAVTIQVMGSYFETEQTKTKLMDIVRDATDATSFKYVQIGET